MNFFSAADCLAATGSVFPVLGLVLAVTLVIIGAAVVLVRKKLAKTALIVIPVLILAGLVWGNAPSARAESTCESLSSMPVPSASASSSSSSAPGGSAPTITTVGRTVTFDSPWTIEATGEGPIVFGIYTFTYMQATAARLSIDANTGVVTPPTGADRLAACTGSGFGNTLAGMQIGFYASNAYGGMLSPVYFTIDDHVWCAQNIP